MFVKQLIIKPKKMNTNLFNKLIKNLKSTTGNDLKNVGFQATVSGVTLDFQGDSDDNYNSYKEIKLSNEQIDKLENIINSKVKEIEEIREQSEINSDGDFKGDYYDYYGVSPEMFINTNF